MSFPSFFQHFAGRRTPRPNSPPNPQPSSVLSRHRKPMRIDPISGSAPTAFAPPEPSSSPTPVNAFGEPIPGAAPGQQRNINPMSTSAKGVPIVRGGAPPMRITPVNVRRSGGEQS